MEKEDAEMSLLVWDKEVVAQLECRGPKQRRQQGRFLDILYCNLYSYNHQHVFTQNAGEMLTKTDHLSGCGENSSEFVEQECHKEHSLMTMK